MWNINSTKLSKSWKTVLIFFTLNWKYIGLIKMIFHLKSIISMYIILEKSFVYRTNTIIGACAGCSDEDTFLTPPSPPPVLEVLEKSKIFLFLSTERI